MLAWRRAGEVISDAALLIAQRDYKRMLAYHSIEHMGLLALGTAAGGRLALAAVLLHILGHGLAKSVLFLSSGHLQQALGSTRIHAVRGLAGRAPLLAGTFGLGLFALLGLPPAPGPDDSAARLRLPASTGAVLVGGLLACAALGVSSWPLRPLLHAAAAVAGGS